MIKAQTLKGFRDFLPAEATIRNWLKGRMSEIAASWGYQPLETPTLEPLELFVGEIGEDEKLFFSFEDNGGRKVALRYDQTVPTCRVIGQYENELVFPFRRYQIQSVFRAEKPQRGRYREFTQFDIDIFGVAAPEADAEAIAVTLDVYTKLGFTDVCVVVNNRDLLKDLPYKALVAIDKLKKIGENGVIGDMIDKGIPEQKAREYMTYIKTVKPDETIQIIFDYLKQAGFKDTSYTFDPTLARSFSYSQGPIWEIVLPGYSAGSVGGGERYDGMMKRLTGKDIPATGIAFGFDRTIEALKDYNLLPQKMQTTSLLVTIFSSQMYPQALETSVTLRKAGISTELYPDPAAKLDKQLKYADKKGIPYVVIQGPDEAGRNAVKLKSMATKEQSEMTIEQVIDKLKEN
jgi:histidyl-tRNA synthetase